MVIVQIIIIIMQHPFTNYNRYIRYNKKKEIYYGNKNTNTEQRF
jgi:hypothetical protein